MSEAEDVSQVSAEAQQLDQSVCGDLTSKLTKDGAAVSNSNQVGLKSKLGAANLVSSNCRSIELIDKSSNCGQLVKEPSSEADCQNFLGETSEQKNLVKDGSLKFYLVKPCSMVSGLNHSKPQKGCSSPEYSATEKACEHGHDCVDTFETEAVRETHKVQNDVVPGQMMSNSRIEGSELEKSGEGIIRSPDITTGGCTEAPNKDANDQLRLSFEHISNKPKCEQLEPLPDDKSKCTNNLHQVVVVLALKSAAEDCARKKSGTVQKALFQKSGTKPKSSTPYANCRSSGRKHRKTPETGVNSEYALRSSPAQRRKGRRFNVQEKSAASEPESQLENASRVRKRGRKKGQLKEGNRQINDEFSRMRVHLRYLLHRIRYEQNLIDAYSSEGWRGQSLEKLRPEKELERAKLDINRSKLKIRALFQRLDEVCAEGQFPETLFDSEGLVDSEDIFCAKCGCKDLSPNNDIILCDGACDRGFHQLCLDPPLRTEEIPPGDEGWYCPACDCKFDCVELVNDSMGTKLSISHSFERVFPEAIAKPGDEQDDVAGLPEDDSEDEEYDPDGAAGDDADMERGESSSDESDFSSASEDLGAINNTDDQYLGLPSDDSEDDDFNPNFLDAEDQPDQNGSSSDFTSASEDLDAAIQNDKISGKNEKPASSSKLAQDCDDIELVTGRRQAEKLDYKKLYDEAYGNTSTDSSEDEDWQDAESPKKRKSRGEDPSNSNKGEDYRVTPKKRRYGPRNASSLTKDAEASASGSSKVVRNTRSADKRLSNPKVGVSNDLQTPETSTVKPTKKTYAKLGEDVVQRLNASFKENQYPDRSTKDKLAEELGLTPEKVSKWFGNTRWTVNHSGVGDATSKVASRGRRKKVNPSSSGTL